MKKLALLLVLPLCMALARTPRESAKPAPLEKIYLEESNTVMLSDMIQPVMVEFMILEMKAKRSALPADKTLYIFIDSGGGFVDPALVLKDAISEMPNTKMICSYCGSAAAMIFEAAKLPRLITDKSSILMHEMYVDHVTASMLKDYLSMAQFIIMSDSFDRLFYEIIGISQAEYMDHIRNQVWVLYGDDISKNHLADQKVSITCSPEVSKLESNICNVNQ